MRVFVTGASGWIGTPLVAELVAGGHRVTGLARSDAAAAKLEAAGVEPVRGTLDDADVLERAAAASDGVVHLGFQHDIAFTGRYADAAASDRRVVETFGKVLAGSDRPLAIAAGVLLVAPGTLLTERDGLEVPEAGGRFETAIVALRLADEGVRSSVVRLPPTVHGAGDHGFMAVIAKAAREKGAAAYVGDGANRWPATHVSDAAHLFRLALERAPAGSMLNAIAEEGIAWREIADAIGRSAGVPATSIAPDEAERYYGFLARYVAGDSPASSAITRELLAWHPNGPGLIEDIDAGAYAEPR